MRIAWWAFVVLGLALLGAGVYTTLASQGSIDYLMSCGITVACGGAAQKAQPRFFLSEPQIGALQQAQLAWLVGIVLVALGLGSTAYGLFTRFVKAEATPLAQT